MDFPFYRQSNAMDCGPTCLQMISMNYGKSYNAAKLGEMAGFSNTGVSLLGISDTAEKLGFRTLGVKITLQKLDKASQPAILYWDRNHFVVLTKLTKCHATIADPGRGIIDYSISQFKEHWFSDKNESNADTGIALLLEPTPTFYQLEGV